MKTNSRETKPESPTNSNETKAQSPAIASDDETRRAALAKMGLYTAYTAPIILAMMEAAMAQTASGFDVIKIKPF